MTTIENIKNIEVREIFQFVNDKNRRAGILLAEGTYGKTFKIGYAFVHPKHDKFNRDRAFNIARGRLGVDLEYADIPVKYHEELALFVKRCERYFNFDAPGVIAFDEEDKFSYEFLSRSEALAQGYNEVLDDLEDIKIGGTCPDVE